MTRQIPHCQLHGSVGGELEHDVVDPVHLRRLLHRLQRRNQSGRRTFRKAGRWNQMIARSVVAVNRRPRRVAGVRYVSVLIHLTGIHEHHGKQSAVRRLIAVLMEINGGAVVILSSQMQLRRSSDLQTGGGSDARLGRIIAFDDFLVLTRPNL